MAVFAMEQEPSETEAFKKWLSEPTYVQPDEVVGKFLEGRGITFTQPDKDGKQNFFAREIMDDDKKPSIQGLVGQDYLRQVHFHQDGFKSNIFD